MTVSTASLSRELAAARRCDHLAEGEARRLARHARRAARELHFAPFPAVARGGAAAWSVRAVSGIRRVLRAPRDGARIDGWLRPDEIPTR